ncbi:MAG: DUF2306 domain-containing protein [Trueperaceae bacterium]
MPDRMDGSGFIVPLILLSLVPTIAGTVRLVGLSSGETITPENARFHAMPLPVVIHILGSLPFCILGTFQFAPGFRKHYPTLHRTMGKWLMVAGLASGLSGLYMTLFYPISQQLQGPVLLIVRLLVGAGMALSIVMAWYRVRQRNIKEHRAWMLRAYALGQGAGTQVIVFLPWTLLLGEANGLTRDFLMTLAWVINFAFAEWLINKPTSKTQSTK